ncbi:type II toxin-antitoxin system HicB family antitoxin [uncultured Alsobacter sp.]|uniref:type II toxin-antitoxin system HicB family antitoxin n=1 Tax=uncultured Alsobacter sp. TaxID=1748258 RepID=UPI0025E28119|nr:type II toxin-antitoxin system HicB family antitoxin [uncultured Alsobacter sp.]
MKHYVAIIEKEEGTLFGVHFPDCPGCVTAAETADAAVTQAAEALRLWAEVGQEAGATPSGPRPLQQVLADKEVAVSIARGGIPFLVPLLVDSGRPARANISLDRNLLDAIDKAAKARGLTRSAFLASAARDKILAEV